MSITSSSEGEAQIVAVSRLVRGPREVVWRMWTHPKHLAAWWGPRGYTSPECEIDPRPGGRIRILMRSDQGEEFLTSGTVEFVRPPESLGFTISLLGTDGDPNLTNHTTVELEEYGAQTKVTVRVQAQLLRNDARDSLTGMQSGWLESLDRLSEALDERST
jgi:uncharacterized protein YndB with AHSA1/START domain